MNTRALAIAGGAAGAVLAGYVFAHVGRTPEVVSGVAGFEHTIDVPGCEQHTVRLPPDQLAAVQQALSGTGYKPYDPPLAGLCPASGGRQVAWIAARNDKTGGNAYLEKRASGEWRFLGLIVINARPIPAEDLQVQALPPVPR